MEQRSVVKVKENMKETNDVKYFISQITYNNMKSLARGFIGYVQRILNVEKRMFQHSIPIKAAWSRYFHISALWVRII